MTSRTIKPTVIKFHKIYWMHLILGPILQDMSQTLYSLMLPGYSLDDWRTGVQFPTETVPLPSSEPADGLWGQKLLLNVCQGHFTEVNGLR
jgi:hypothetical protein